MAGTAQGEAGARCVPIHQLTSYQVDFKALEAKVWAPVPAICQHIL